MISEEDILNLSQKSFKELRKIFHSLQAEESKVSNLRHNIHQAIDSLKEELTRRIREEKILFTDDEIIKALESAVKSVLISPSLEREKNLSKIEKELSNLKESTSLSNEELSETLTKLLKWERTISYRRRILHGWIDVLNEEIERRKKKEPNIIESKDVKELVEEISKILSKGF
jgi:hypothetical protein